MRVVVTIIILTAIEIVGAVALLCVIQIGKNRIDAPSTPVEVRVCHVYLLCREHPTETPLTRETTILYYDSCKWTPNSGLTSIRLG